MGELWEKRLKAYWKGKMFLVTGLPAGGGGGQQEEGRGGQA
jgi:hypothetical protein